MNNPLAYLTTNLEFLRHTIAGFRRDLDSVGADDPNERLDAVARLERGMSEALEAIDEAGLGAARVARIVDELRSFSRGAIEESDSVVDLAPILDSSIQLVKGDIRRRARLVQGYRDSLHVHGSAARLGEVFVNLLVNATQALPEGQPEDHEIRVTVRPRGPEWYVVELVDTGCGIAPANLERIFDPFFTTRPAETCTGLGLTVCHRLVSSFGGEIHVDSGLARGTTVRVSLRRARRDRRSVLPRSSVSAPPEPATVLIVASEPLAARAMERWLARQHRVMVANNGAEALDVARRSERIDVLFCDPALPDMTGEELCSSLREVGPELAERVIFVVGPAPSESIDVLPNARIEKPVSRLELEEAVACVLVASPDASRHDDP